MSNIEHSSTHHYWIRNRDLTCVTTSSKPNNDGIWEIVSEISWTVWVPRSWTATVYDFLDKQSAACGWSPIVLHHPQEIWSRNSIPTSRNFSGHTKEVYVCTLTVKKKNLEINLMDKTIFNIWFCMEERVIEMRWNATWKIKILQLCKVCNNV